MNVKEFSLKSNGNEKVSTNFKVKEFKCKDGSDAILVDIDFVAEKLQAMRDKFGTARVNSGYRTETYNAKVGGATNSYHVKGRAFDVTFKNGTISEWAAYAYEIGITGIIQYNTFVHLDSRDAPYYAINNNGKITKLTGFESTEKESVKVIDVSTYQGTIDWEKAKADGVQGAIFKIINKSGATDSQFERNWSECSSANINLPIYGVYNYSYATSVSEAEAYAKKVIEVLNGRTAKVYLDVEDKCQQGIGQLLVDIINAYKAVIEAAGLEFEVYTGLSFYKSYIKPYSGQINCRFWIARYPSTKTMKLSDTPDMTKKPVIDHELSGWQYSSAGSVSGIGNNVDLNIMYI